MNNELIDKVGDILCDPDISESTKNGVSLAVMTHMLNNYELESQNWNKCQTEILEKLKHHVPGSEIRQYNMKIDKQAGAYLYIDLLPLYRVEIDIEDVKTIEEFFDRQVVKICIYHEPTEDDPEKGEIFNSGFVETMQEAGEIINLLKKDKFNEAMRLLFRLKSGRQNFKKIRTKKELDDIVKKSSIEYTCSWM